MKKLFFLFSVLALVCSASAALAYRQNGEGLYVDDSGNLIEDYWDDAAGIYIVNGVGYAIESAEGGAVSAAPAFTSPLAAELIPLFSASSFTPLPFSR